MEPAINQDLHDTTDLTPDLLADIGWYGAPTATTVAMFTAENRGDGVMLRWKLSDAATIAVITVERGVSESGPWAPIQTELSEVGGVQLALDTNAEVGKTYFYRLRFDERDGTQSYSSPISGSRTALYTGPALLSAPWPNPTPAGAMLSFRLGKPEYVRLAITDASGRRVRTLYEGMMAPGDYTQNWNGLSDHGANVPPRIDCDAGTSDAEDGASRRCGSSAPHRG
jgi:hypothetical protein